MLLQMSELVTVYSLPQCQAIFLRTAAELLGIGFLYTDMRHLTTGIRSEKCVVRRFRRYANVYVHNPR